MIILYGGKEKIEPPNDDGILQMELCSHFT